ncbi:filamentous hemagglutinin N-terminal domain-containing protein [Nostoc sphaeroides]|nr:S-layer family protein [Nostoc sphaeroides]
MRAMSTTGYAYAFLSTLTIGLFTPGMMRSAYAQVISDGTTNTIVNPSGNNFNILNGIEKGNNLFHSFTNFSVPINGSATFDLVNTPNITTIFSRVTGGNISNIDGLIRTANTSKPISLFLMNPAGIVFGKDAALNIGGSFIGTTANSIQFADGLEFSAVNSTAPPLLTMSVPIGLQLGSSASQIQVQGKGNDYIVPTNNLGIVASPGKTIALVGGDITFTGGVITAPVGRIEIGAVGSGTVSLTPTPAGWQLGYAQVEDFRDINFTQRSSLWNPYPVGNPFGGIQVVGRDIHLNQSQIAAVTAGTGQGGNITVNAARSLSLGGVNANAQAPSAWIVNSVLPGVTGNGGAVNIQAGQLTLKDGAAIETLSLGAGAAGKVEVRADTITASGTVRVNSPLAPTGSSSSRISSETYASGAGGDVTVVARQLTLKESGVISTAVFPGATGRGGNISVNVAEDISAIGAHPLSLTASGIGSYTSGIGNGGNIDVSTGTLHLLEGGEIFAPSVRFARIPGTGVGNAGDITVVARQAIDMVGTYSILPTLISGIGSFTTGSGNGGNVSVTTPMLTLQAGAILSTSTLPVFGIFGDAKQSNNLGNAGNLTVNVADSLTVTGINQFTKAPTVLGSNTLSNGKAGDVTIQTNHLAIQNGGSINTFTQATGNAGALTIQANDILIEGSSIAASAPITDKTTRQFYGLPDVPTGNTGRLNIITNRLSVRDNGRVTVTHSGTGNAGQLNIQADRVFLDKGIIRASSISGEGGDINLDVANVLLTRNGSTITAEAGGSGNGGNITIKAPLIVGLENSDIIANAFEGKGGNIQITTQGIFGLKYRTQLTSLNDITASSKFGVNGNVQITSPDVDPNSGLMQLPVNLVDASQQIATGCTSNEGSRFVATGRGGVPQNPNQQIGSDRTWSDIRDLSAYRSTQTVQAQIPKSPEVLVQATGWRRNAQDKIEIFADKSPPGVQPALTCAAVTKS